MNWQHLNHLIDGVSLVDTQGLAIRNRKVAQDFLREYGIDPDDPKEMEHAGEIHREAVQLIEDYFLKPGQGDRIPKEVRHPENLMDLLIYSSSNLDKPNARQMWSCAVLKVMHSIFHIDFDLKLHYFDEVRRQIFDSFEKVIEEQDDKRFLIGGRYERIPLVHYERKRNKDRTSIILKLLQKPANVASDIYDHLGLRLIFNTRIECLFALKILRRSHLITTTNIKPFRSRNSLIDLGIAKKVFSRFRPAISRTGGYPSEIFKKIDKEMGDLDQVGPFLNNPHSSHHYRAIQVTCRKMIKIPNPAFENWRDLYDIACRLESQGDTGLKERINESRPEEKIHFYFDFEVQIQDKISYDMSLYGPASHQAYKERQRTAARKRVLGSRLIEILDNP